MVRVFFLLVVTVAVIAAFVNERRKTARFKAYQDALREMPPPRPEDLRQPPDPQRQFELGHLLRQPPPQPRRASSGFGIALAVVAVVCGLAMLAFVVLLFAMASSMKSSNK